DGKAVLTRPGEFCQKLVCKDLRVKPLKGEVWRFNESFGVTQIELKRLQHMMEDENLITRGEDLINQVDANAEQAILHSPTDAPIKKLRKKIEKDPATPDRIVTVRGWGYNLSYV